MASSDEWCERHGKPKFACSCVKQPQAYQNDSPPEFSPMMMSAIEFYEVYAANVRAGFTEPQALYILAVQMTGNPGIAPGLDLPTPPEQQ